MMSAIERADSQLYFISCRGIYKIGISQDVQRRVRNLEIGMQSPVKIITAGPCIDMEEIHNNPRTAERIWHARLARYRLDGEWFNLPQRIANRIEIMMWSEVLPTDRRKQKTASHPPPSLFRVDS